MKINFVHTPRPRPYRHVPVFYDEEEEDSKEKIGKAKEKMGAKNEGQPFKPTLERGSFRKKRIDNEVDAKLDIRKQSRMANFRLLMILCVFVLLGLILYFTSEAFLLIS